MVNDPRYLWWAVLFDGWLTTDRFNGNGNGDSRGNGYGYGNGYGNGYGYGYGRGTPTYGQ